MLQEVNLDVGIGNGYSRPVESLVFLQISHADQNLLAEAHSFGHQI